MKHLLSLTLLFSAVTYPPKPWFEVNCGSTYNSDGTLNVISVWKLPEETWLKQAIGEFRVLTTLNDIQQFTHIPLKTYSIIILDTDVSHV